MKVRATFLSGFACAASLAISGCGRAAAPPAPQRPASSATPPQPAWHSSRLTLTDAQTLIAAWRRQNLGERQWPRKAMLWEITPADVWNRMGAQVFHYASPFVGQERWKAAGLHPPADDAYFVRDRRVSTLLPGSSGFGGAGIERMCVCDLDRDTLPELVYTYSSGSGIQATSVVALRLAERGPALYDGGVVMFQGLAMERRDDQTVLLYTAHRSWLLGRLAFVRKGGRLVFGVRLAPSLPSPYGRSIAKGLHALGVDNGAPRQPAPVSPRSPWRGQ